MLEVIGGFIGTVAAIGAGGVGYLQSRRFVSKRLRYVDQAQSPVVPVVAGVGAAVVGAPVALVLPFIGAGTVLVFALAVAFGTRAGVKSFGRAMLP
jgi:hypothetical protein